MDLENDEIRTVIETMALLDAAGHRLNALGHEQAMSVGPALAELSELRDKTVMLAEGYGVLDPGVDVAQVRHEATDFDVSVEMEGDDA